MPQFNEKQIKDKALSGASLIAGFQFYDETEDLAIGEIRYWKLREYITNTTITGGDESDLSQAPDISSDWDLHDSAIYSIYPSVAQIFTDTRITIEFDTERNTDSKFSVLAGEITFNQPDIYFLAITVSNDISTGTARSGSDSFVQLDTGSGYNDIPNIGLFQYHRTATVGKDTASIIIPISVNAGYKIRVQTVRYGGADTLTTIPSGCNVSIFSSQGKTGLKGADGDIVWSGSWSSQDYIINQAVEYLGSSYVCKLNTTSNQNPLDGIYWDLIAQKGNKGQVWQGGWVLQNYLVDDVVRFLGSTYICILNTTSSQNPLDGTYWDIQSSKGDTGNSGNWNPQGTWVSQNYVENDVVTYNGNLYYCDIDTTSSQLPTDTNFWTLYVEKGIDGAGSSVIGQDEGGVIPGGPFSTINFIGDGITASNGGSGVLNVTVRKPISVRYGKSDTQTPSATEAIVVFNEDLKVHSDITRVGGRLTVNRDINLWVDYSVHQLLDSNDTARNTIITYLKVNGTVVDYSDGASYTRGYNYDRHGKANGVGIYLALSMNDYIELFVVRDDDLQTPTIGNSKTWITMKEEI